MTLYAYVYPYSLYVKTSRMTSLSHSTVTFGSYMCKSENRESKLFVLGINDLMTTRCSFGKYRTNCRYQATHSLSSNQLQSLRMRSIGDAYLASCQTCRSENSLFLHWFRNFSNEVWATLRSKYVLNLCRSAPNYFVNSFHQIKWRIYLRQI